MCRGPPGQPRDCLCAACTRLNWGWQQPCLQGPSPGLHRGRAAQAKGGQGPSPEALTDGQVIGDGVAVDRGWGVPMGKGTCVEVAGGQAQTLATRGG